jgi:hypothetical protein
MRWSFLMAAAAAASVARAADPPRRPNVLAFFVTAVRKK